MVPHVFFCIFSNLLLFGNQLHSGVLAQNVQVSDDFNLVILHNNDLHSRFEETARNSGTCKNLTGTTGNFTDGKGCVGGFARTAHEVRRHRKVAEDGGPPVVFLNAGDTYIGTAWYTIHKWKICADFWNLLKPDAMCLGNHEFDDGVAGLVPFLNNVTFPIVTTNLDLSKEPTIKNVARSVILEVRGRKIGILGHLLPDTQIISFPGQVQFLPTIESLRNEAEALDRAGVNIIIVLGHSGFEMDKRIAREVPLVDLVIGGHTNTFLWNGPQPDMEVPDGPYPVVEQQSNGKQVPVVQAYAYTKYLGRLNVTFDNSGNLLKWAGQPELLDTSIPQDQDVLDLVAKYKPEIEQLNTNIIGTTHVVLDDKKCRKTECNFGNLVADAFVINMATSYAGTGWTDHPIGLIMGGGIRITIDASASAGNISYGNILDALPFGNQVIAAKIKGSDLLETLEIGARSNGDTSGGEFLQVSGLHVTYNMSKPSLQRVVSVVVRCGNCTIPTYSPLDPEGIYGIVTVSFLTEGGDGHTVLKEKTRDQQVLDLSDVDLVSWYIGNQSPIFVEESGRIVVVGERGPIPTTPKPPTPSSASGVVVTTALFVLTFLMGSNVIC